MKDLHDAIMNLPSNPGMLHESMHCAYEMGHRDARHAAAELAVAASEQEPAACHDCAISPSGVHELHCPESAALPQAQPAADLTDDEIGAAMQSIDPMWWDVPTGYTEKFARAVLAAQKGKNDGS